MKKPRKNPAPAKSEPPPMPLEIEQPQDTYADFVLRVVSPEAAALVTDLTERISEQESQQKQQKSNAPNGSRGPYKRGTKGSRSLSEAVGRFVGHLLIAKSAPDLTGKVFRSLNKETFTGAPVGRTAFNAAWKGLEGLGLVNRTPGKPRFHPTGFDNAPMQVKGQASIFEATDRLLAVAEQHGVSLDRMAEHFIRPRAPLELHTFGTWDWTSKGTAQKFGGRSIRFTPDAQTEALTEQVRRLNEFLGTFDMKGGRFFGFCRIFSTDAEDTTAFPWDKGGRLYAYGGSTYQSLTGDQRACITINGEPTVEVDISASYLTIFHGLTKQPLDTKDGGLWDRVQIEDKQVAKDWINLSLTNGRRLRKWPQNQIDEYRMRCGGRLEADYPVPDVEAKAIRAFPALKEVDTSSLTWAELMFAEAEVVIAAMLRLMDQSVPAFPVFDSIIVPLSKVRLATGVLYDEFYQRIGRRPLLKAKSNLPGASEAVRAAIHDDDRWVSALDL